MKDAYSFDLDADGARTAYNKMFVSYLKTFARMGLTARKKFKILKFFKTTFKESQPLLPKRLCLVI